MRRRIRLVRRRIRLVRRRIRLVRRRIRLMRRFSRLMEYGMLHPVQSIKLTEPAALLPGLPVRPNKFCKFWTNVHI